jgi:hypothetical protein
MQKSGWVTGGERQYWGILRQETNMRRIQVSVIAVKKIAMVFLVVTAWPAIAQDVKTPNPNMAPVDQYLMGDREAEIALARSAAPESISRDAEILVLGRHGYETAVKG